MNRIDAIFADLRSDGRKALMPYLTAGDPDVATTAAMLPAVESAGASICEVGFPFSDPIADGPVIQASMSYALDHGARVRDILDAVRDVRPNLSLGLVAMLSWSIPYRFGPAQFIAACKDAGFDGFIFPDLPVEESDDALGLVRDAGMIASLLIAPSTPIERAQRIAQASSGFLYVLSRAGLTGEQTELPSDLPDRLNKLRDVTDLPIAVGFGISTPEQVGAVVRVADAAIVGSAIVRRIADRRELERDALVEHVSGFVGELAQGLNVPTTQA